MLLFLGGFLGGFLAEVFFNRVINLQLEKSISDLEKRVSNLEY